jgi:predicted MPP superfamily phosphohydrolase
MGNHDHWTGPGGVRRALRAAGVRELPNQVLTVRRNDARLYIVGADDPWCKKANVAPIVKNLPSRGAAILLAHEPDYADNFCQYKRFDLQLSGHSHGGQVALPLIGPLALPGAGQKYPRGQYQVEDMKLYTNRGLGTSGARGFHVRFNCRPEITLFTLRTVNQHLA